MWVRTMWGSASGAIPRASSARATGSTDVPGPVSTSTGRSARTRYAAVYRARPPMNVSIAVTPSATSNVTVSTVASLRPAVSVGGAIVRGGKGGAMVTVNVVV